MSVICHVISGLGTGGAERALWRLLANGLHGPFENHVICLAGSGPIGDAIAAIGVPVHVLGLQSAAQGPAALSQITQLLRNVHPRLIQGWMYHGNLAASLAGKLVARDTPIAWNIRQGLDDIAGDKLATRLAIRAGAVLSNQPAAIIYNSSRSAAEHEAFGFSARRTHFVPNGFEVGSIEPDPSLGAVARQRYRIPPDAFLFAHIARWHPMKDHATFVTAAKRCASEAPGSHFFLAGRGVGLHVSSLLADLPDDLRNRFHVKDEIVDPLDIMQAADALVVSSKRAEGFPNVLGEAMMTATPCITTDVGESPQVVGDGGLVVPHSDPAALSEAMLVLARDLAAATELGKRARARVEREFDIRAIVERYRALYTELIGSKAS